MRRERAVEHRRAGAGVEQEVGGRRTVDRHLEPHVTRRVLERHPRDPLAAQPARPTRDRRRRREARRRDHGIHRHRVEREVQVIGGHALDPGPALEREPAPGHAPVVGIGDRDGPLIAARDRPRQPPAAVVEPQAAHVAGRRGHLEHRVGAARVGGGAGLGDRAAALIGGEPAIVLEPRRGACLVEVLAVERHHPAAGISAPGAVAVAALGDPERPDLDLGGAALRALVPGEHRAAHAERGERAVDRERVQAVDERAPADRRDVALHHRAGAGRDGGGRGARPARRAEPGDQDRGRGQPAKRANHGSCSLRDAGATRIVTPALNISAAVAERHTLRRVRAGPPRRLRHVDGAALRRRGGARPGSCPGPRGVGIMRPASRVLLPMTMEGGF